MTELRKFFDDSDDLCRYVRKLSGPRVILSFSRGKDAIACWLKLREHFDEVVPYFLYSVPGVQFVEESLDYYERFFGTKITRLPHPSLYRKLTEHVFQPPERMGLGKMTRLRTRYDYADVEEVVRRKFGLDAAWGAVGIREVDSVMRRLQIRKNGPLQHSRRSFFPIYDWKAEFLREQLTKSGVKLPVDYRLFGRSWDGLQWDYLEPIRREFPDDYERIVRWFPLAPAVLKKRKFYQPEEGSEGEES